MISLPLYKQGLRGVWKTLLIFAALLTMYFTVMITMFDPAMNNALDELAKMIPELMTIIGMTATSSTMIGFMSGYLYGFIMLLFPMIFSILTANQLVARHVDRGSMAYLLAAPVSRRTVVLTEMLVLITSVTALIAYATLVGVASAELMFPGELDIGLYLLLNVGALALHLFIGSICFLASASFSDAKVSMGLAAGIPAAEFVVQMLANAGKALEPAKYATFFTLYNPDGIISGDSGAMLGIAVLAAGALVLYTLSVVIFTRKDLPI